MTSTLREALLRPATWEDTQGAYLLSKDAVPAEQQSVRVFDSWVLVFSQKENHEYLRRI